MAYKTFIAELILSLAIPKEEYTKVRELIKNGKSIKQIVKKYKIDKSKVVKIING